MDDTHENIDKYNLGKKRKLLIIFDDMVADFLRNKKASIDSKALFIRIKKQIISIVFIPQPYFAVAKHIRLNSTHYFIMKISNKKELQPIAINYLSDIDILRLYESLQKIYCKTIFFSSQ